MSEIINSMDLSVNPCEDFYKYATGNWLANNPQPKEYPSWNTYTKVADMNLKRLEDIIVNNNSNDEMSKKITDLYNLYMDYDRRNEMSNKELVIKLEAIEQIKDRDELLKHSTKNLFELFFSTSISIDDKNSSKYEIYVWQGGLSLQNKDYYLKNSKEIIKIRNAYKKYVKNMLVLSGYSASQAQNMMRKIFSIEKSIAKVSYSVEDLREPEKNYHMIELNSPKDKDEETIAEFFKQYLPLVGYDKTDKIIVGQIQPILYAIDIWKNLSLEDLKTYYKWDMISAYSTALSEDFYREGFEFSKVVTGIEEEKPKWKRGVMFVSNIFDDVISQAYVKKYFDETDKNRIKTLVNNLKKSFKDIILSQEWMSQETKKVAIEKLDGMIVKIGYPDKWDDLSDLKVDPEKSLLSNKIEISKFFYDLDIKKHYNKNVDKSEWWMTAYDVNAYYSPNNNEICFPAGILEPPYYDKSLTGLEVVYNYGSIGSIIGHEMTHGFDNHGKLFDKDGILKEWWKEEDSKKFDQFTKNTVKRFDSLEALPGLKCNGKLTLGENLADYGGIKIAFYAFDEYLKETYKDKYDKVYEEAMKMFFVGYAFSEAGILKEESIRERVMNDEHTIPSLRVNGILPMFDKFIEVFHIKPGDKMFLEKEKRAKIW